MAPIPEDNQDKPPDNDDSEIGHFSNPNLAIPMGNVDSDGDSDDENNFGPLNGYTLLPQEPTEDGDMDDEVHDQENLTTVAGEPVIGQTQSSNAESTVDTNNLSEAILSAEAGATSRMVSVSSSSYHPAFLAKYPDSKLPSYMEVPSIPVDNGNLLWNETRQDSSKFPIDTAQETKILKAMSGFSLPTQNIPDWARNMPDEQWQKQVVEHICAGQKSTKPSTERHTQEALCEPAPNSCDSVQGGDKEWVAQFPDSH